jgi:hypothetical protein
MHSRLPFECVADLILAFAADSTSQLAPNLLAAAVHGATTPLSTEEHLICRGSRAPAPSALIANMRLRLSAQKQETLLFQGPHRHDQRCTGTRHGEAII